MFKKVLIANRGEIAVRVSQTLQEMGIAALAVYSDADRKALHVMRADEAVPLAGTALAETYLNQARLIADREEGGSRRCPPGLWLPLRERGVSRGPARRRVSPSSGRSPR